MDLGGMGLRGIDVRRAALGPTVAPPMYGALRRAGEGVSADLAGIGAGLRVPEYRVPAKSPKDKPRKPAAATRAKACSGGSKGGWFWVVAIIFVVRACINSSSHHSATYKPHPLPPPTFNVPHYTPTLPLPSDRPTWPSPTDLTGLRSHDVNPGPPSPGLPFPTTRPTLPPSFLHPRPLFPPPPVPPPVDPWNSSDSSDPPAPARPAPRQ
jgi:hypothetical protein